MSACNDCQPHRFACRYSGDQSPWIFQFTDVDTDVGLPLLLDGASVTLRLVTVARDAVTGESTITALLEASPGVGVAMALDDSGLATYTPSASIMTVTAETELIGEVVLTYSGERQVFAFAETLVPVAA